MALKLPRTIRLDPSDTFVYARAAEPGEWAVTGTFLFHGIDVADLEGKARQAFRAGFLGVGSFGWSTLAVVTEVSAEEYARAVEDLARRLVDHCGAPDIVAARPAAEEEIAFARILCDHPPNMLIGIHRSLEEDGIRESFRTLRRRAGRETADAFGFEAEDGKEEVDLVTLSGEKRAGEGRQ